MSTRSYIVAKFDEDVAEDRGLVGTYCHYDGYLSGVGQMLITDYNNAERAFTAADFGYISSLPKFSELLTTEMANEDDPDYFASNVELFDFLAGSDCEYLYVWEDGKWHWASLKNGEPVLAELTLKDMVPEWRAALAYCREQSRLAPHGSDKAKEWEASAEEYLNLLDRAECEGQTVH